MAGIVAVTRFCEASGEAFARYIDYIDRDKASQKENSDKFDLFSGYLDYMGDERKVREPNDEEMSNLFSKDSYSMGIAEKKEMKELFKEAQLNESNMWQTVISFENHYLERYGILESDGKFNEKKLIDASRKAISSMLHSEKLDNAVWTAAFHYNTDNIHIHIAIVEPNPMREKGMYRQWERISDGNVLYRLNEVTGRKEKVPKLDKNGNQIILERYKGTFKGSSIDKLKSVMRSEIEQDKDTTIQISNLLRGIVKDKKERNLLEEPEFSKSLMEIYRNIKDTGANRKYWNYNQNSFSHIRPKINDLSDLFISKYHQDDYDNLIAKLGEKSASFASSYGGTNEYMNSKLYDKRDGLYTRLGNAILKELQSYDRLVSTQKSDVKKATELLESGNVEEAVDLLEGCSDLGNTFAQNKLGIMYLKGDGVNRDVEKAKGYFKKSASSGNSFGQDMLNNIENSKGKGGGSTRDPLATHAKRDIRRALNQLRRDLETEYMSWRNQQSYEELQIEIAHRGQEL